MNSDKVFWWRAWVGNHAVVNVQYQVCLEMELLLLIISRIFKLLSFYGPLLMLDSKEEEEEEEAEIAPEHLADWLVHEPPP
ncbi:Uncharacterized protein TCM_010272 [Theobroma cacao]|uniref:Uncharacterized protein n=1 Tax=Theobroma cacao TaxID=3641 RepID=A0A061E5Z0_THECC|nr:Uncharacterized protein TCM_010272 [Theobroma cacao]